MHPDPQLRATLRWFGLFVLLVAFVVAGAIYSWRRSAPAPLASQRPPVQSDLSQGPHELVPESGVFYLGSDTSYGYTASYAIRTRDGILIIDPGLRFDTLVENMTALKLDPAQIKEVVITHRHADHWFAARELVDKTGARIHAHADEIPVLQRPGDLRQYYTIYASPVTQVPVLANLHPLRDGDRIQLGDVSLEVLSTPGHTPGSACYRVSARGYDLLFSGDTIMTLSPLEHDGDYMTRLGPAFGGDVKTYIATLQRLRDTPFDFLLPGHPLLGKEFDPVAGARVWRSSVDAKIAMLRERFERRPVETKAYLDAVPKRITDQIVYLGDARGVASYAIVTSDGVVVFDPGRRSIDELQTIFESLDLNLGDVKAVLLTGVVPQHAEAARALCELTGASLWCGELPEASSIAESFRPDRQLKAQESFTVGDVKIETLAGMPRAGADLCYVVHLQGKVALVSGDSVTRFNAVRREAHPDVDKSLLGEPTRVNDSIRKMREIDVDFLLPAHPQVDDSPFFTREEWQKRMTEG